MQREAIESGNQLLLMGTSVDASGNPVERQTGNSEDMQQALALAARAERSRSGSVMIGARGAQMDEASRKAHAVNQGLVPAIVRMMVRRWAYLHPPHTYPPRLT